jgi:NAD(P)-dependent dehydrogenase (short-subunit alcohol dehydrogenase family)
MKTVFITGVSRGIGKGLAQKFLKEGYYVIGTSIDGMADSTHENLSVVQLDLYEEHSINGCVENVKKMGMVLDIVINNAGVLLDEGEPEIVPEKLRKTLEVNVVGPINLTQQLLPLINNGGHILNISSSAGSLERVHHPDYPAYKISKAALNMFTAYLAWKLKGEITVSSIHPGRVKTDMGGWEGDMTIEEAAEHIYKTATTSNLETGQFWFKGEKFPW